MISPTTTFGLDGERPESHAHWDAEQEVIGPGLQAVMLWSRLSVGHAQGSVLTDLDGNQVLDFQGAGGVNSLGHANPRYVAAMSAELTSAPAGAFGSRARRDLADTLRGFLPQRLDKIQLYSGGAEAVEAGMRLAKSVTGNHEFLSFWGGFHGKTMGALSLTSGARKALGPLPPGSFSAPYANCYRCPLKLKKDSCDMACLDLVRSAIKQDSTGALAGIVVEPVQGRSGNVVPPRGYLARLKDIAADHDALLIVDEMMTGFGRTGSDFAYQQDGGDEGERVDPDILTVGKGMGAGYPVTGVIASATHMAAAPFSDPSASSSSFGAFPLACRAVATTVDALIDEDLVARAAKIGGQMLDRLSLLTETAPLVGDVRGQGLAIGLELVHDKATREPASSDTVRRAFLALLDAGVLVMTGGNTLRLYPPLTVSEDHADIAAEVIVRTLNGLDR